MGLVCEKRHQDISCGVSVKGYSMNGGLNWTKYPFYKYLTTTEEFFPVDRESSKASPRQKTCQAQESPTTVQKTRTSMDEWKVFQHTIHKYLIKWV